MGGDYAPGVVVEGALAALQEKDDFEVIFVGDKDRIGECLKDKTYDKDRVKIVHTTQIIGQIGGRCASRSVRHFADAEGA